VILRFFAWLLVAVITGVLVGALVSSVVCTWEDHA
jgi:hypothetical protein